MAKNLLGGPGDKVEMRETENRREQNLSVQQV